MSFSRRGRPLAEEEKSTDATKARARAMELLQGEQPVGEVAQAVGFGSLCHFSREFKKELGITPTQYRLQAGRDDAEN